MKNIRIYLPCTAVLLFTVVHILVVQDPTHRYFCLNNNNENEQCRVEDKQNFLVYGLDSSFPSQFFSSIFGENLDEFTQLGTDLEKLQAVQVALADILLEISVFSEHFQSNMPHFWLRIKEEELRMEN